MSRTPSDTSERPRRMDPGTLWPSVWAFADHLMDLGYTPVSVANCLKPARHFTVWLAYSDIAPSDVDGQVVERFLHHRCQCPAKRRARIMTAANIRGAYRFLRFLAENGVVPASVLPVTAPPPKTINPELAELSDWLRHRRGITEATIAGYQRTLMCLLPALGSDPAAYDAGLVRRVILEEAETRSSRDIKAMTTALRGYLRFLIARGACRPGLDEAVPTIARWRLSALPRYLPATQVEAMIASCDPTTPAGVRDRAILLLLTRLGLRAGDIQTMRLSDLDWERATLRVCGKGRREIRLPLPQDAGDALLTYLAEARPDSASPFVFLRSVAPFKPFERSTVVSHVVDRALTRAGITDAPSQGTNLLRHSAATAWLRAGATLDAIGTVLRHRSTDTTAHYAKVDIPTLQGVVQPWPGDEPC